jgi:hypothetical protein
MVRNLKFGPVIVFWIVLCVTTAPQASPELGAQFPAFKLQGLDSQFYGTEGAEGKISVLYFLGYNCAPCVGAGPYLESEMWAGIKQIPNVQFMGLDLWNGTIPQLNQYKSITGVTFPLLKQAGLTRNYAGAGLSDMVVIDQEGYVRLVINGEDRNAYADVFAMIASLQNKTPIVRMITKTLYYGRTMQVGEVKSQDATVTNTGAGSLEITGINSPIPNVVMEPPAFTLAPYASQTVSFTFAPTQTGTFSGDIVLQHTNTGVPKLKLEFIEVAVSGRVFPSISLGQNSLDFGQVDLDKKIEKVVTIHNAGPGVLAVSDIQSDVARIVISEKQFDIPANGSKDIKVSYQPSSEGAFSGLIQVMSDDPDHAIMSVSLTGTGVFVPADARTDFDGSGKVDFADFLVFAQAFGSTNVLIDVDGSGKVDFADFLTFAQSFGKSVSK